MKPERNETRKEGGNQMQGCVNHAFLFSVFPMLWHLGLVDSGGTASPKVRQFLEISMTFLGACFSHANYSNPQLPPLSDFYTLCHYSPALIIPGPGIRQLHPTATTS